MSKWVSDIVREKQERQSKGARTHGHLQAFEGSKISDGLVVGETLMDKIRRFIRPKPSAPRLRVLNQADEQQ